MNSEDPGEMPQPMQKREKKFTYRANMFLFFVQFVNKLRQICFAQNTFNLFQL